MSACVQAGAGVPGQALKIHLECSKSEVPGAWGGRLRERGTVKVGEWVGVGWLEGAVVCGAGEKGGHLGGGP